jgi:hypothetical protein
MCIHYESAVGTAYLRLEWQRSRLILLEIGGNYSEKSNGWQ